MALSFAKAEEQAKVTYLSTAVEQNWMIIRQLSRLNKNIEKLLERFYRTSSITASEYGPRFTTNGTKFTPDGARHGTK